MPVFLRPPRKLRSLSGLSLQRRLKNKLRKRREAKRLEVIQKFFCGICKAFCKTEVMQKQPLKSQTDFYHPIPGGIPGIPCIPFPLLAPFAIFFIMPRIFSNFFSRRATSATDVPEPLAIRLRRGGPIIK